MHRRLCGAAVLVVSLLAAGAPAAAAATISGHVTDGGDVGIGNICVQVHPATGQGPGPPVASGNTDANGDYTTAPDVPGGSYKVEFRDCSQPATFVTEWWNDRASFFAADALPVGAGDVVGIDAQLAPGHTISGRVTTSAGAGIQNVCVQVTRVTGPGPGPEPPVANGFTNDNGDYTTDPVAPGPHKVEFRDCNMPASFLGEWWNDKRDPGTADVVNVDLADVMNIDAVLVPGRTISGRVTNPEAEGIQGVCVSVNSATGGPGPGAPGPQVGSGFTNMDGDYTTELLPSGDYKVQFRDCNMPPTYVREWWNDKPDVSSADVISLGGANATGIDAELAVGRTISGRVTNSEGSGFQNVCVNAHTANGGQFPGPPVAFGVTNMSGDYTTEPVPVGSYKVQFFQCPAPGQPQTHLGEWWNDKPDFQAADPIDVTAANATNVNAQLAAGRTISGRVTDGNGNGVQGICVSVHDPDDPFGGMQTSFANTDANGDYTTNGVAPGEYKVQFRDCRPAPQLVGEWWNDKPNAGAADVIDLTGANATGVNADLAAGRTISGRVTDSEGNGLQNVCVNVHEAVGDPFDGPSPGFGFTNANGDYTTGPVPPGEYKVQFNHCPGPGQPQTHFGEWWNDKPDFETADVVDLSIANATNVNAQLVAGKRISGTVTGSGPLQGICVNVNDESNGELGRGFGMTNQDGDYSVLVPPGRYKVGFFDCRPNRTHLGEWWNDKPDFETADVVDATSGDVGGIDAELTRGRVISGRVTNAAGDGVEGVCLQVVDAASGEGVEGGGTDANGDYQVAVPPGVYKLNFQDCNAPGDLIPEWWNDKPTEEQADPIDVTGADAANVNAQMATGSTISGRVTRSDGGTGIENVCVRVVTAGNEEVEVGAGETGPTGEYMTTAVPPGDYKLAFNDCNDPQTFLGEWWNDKPDFDGADTISITNANVTGKDAVLAAGRTISGRVTANGAGLPNACVSVVDANDEERSVGGGQTDENGDYRTEVVPPGQYKLHFNDCNETVLYVSEWWNDKPSFDMADPVDVTLANATGKDADLARGGGITGTVTGGGAPLEGMCVNAGGTDVEGFGGAMTGPDGSYRVGGLPSGHYLVRFEDCREDPPGGRFRPQELEDIAVAAPDDTTGVNADMGVPDTTPPDTFITSGPSGTTDDTSAGFTFDANEPDAGFECRLDGGSWEECGPPHGVSGLAPGSHTLEVRAVDSVGLVDESPAGRTWTVTTTPQSTQTTTGTLPPGGGTVMDDPVEGVSAGDPVQTQVSASSGGNVEITEGSGTDSAPAGFTFFGWQVELASTVAATVAEPLTIAFVIHDSLIPAGTDPGDVQVFRNGTAVPDCTGAPDAVPDPCVELREDVGDAVRVQVLTSAASTWNLGQRSSSPAPLPGPAAPPSTAPPSTAPPSTAPPSTAPPPATPAEPVPALRILTRSARAARTGKVALRLACSGANCRGTLTLRARVRQRGRLRTVRLGSVRFSIPVGATRTVTVRLSRANLAQLRRARRLRATVTASLSGGAAVTRTLTLRPPRR